jgi:hypothetical protein
MWITQLQLNDFRLEFALMNTSQSVNAKASQTRLIVAISLFAAALISAVSLTALGNRSDTYWLAANTLIPGMQISESDLKKGGASLGEIGNQYLGSASSVIGSYVTHPISAGELLPINSLSDTAPELRSEQVPLSLRGVDIPSDIEVGEAITIYWVPQILGMEAIPDPELILRGAYLRSIDRKSANFGTDVALTISVYNKEIIELLKSTVSGRLVIVRSRD